VHPTSIRAIAIYGYEIAAYSAEGMQKLIEEIPCRGKYELRLWRTGWGLREHTGNKSDRTRRFRYGMSGEHPEDSRIKFVIFDSADVIQLNSAVTWVMKTVQSNMRMVLGLGK
jgi:hypothetical protein